MSHRLFQVVTAGSILAAFFALALALWPQSAALRVVVIAASGAAVLAGLWWAGVPPAWKRIRLPEVIPLPEHMFDGCAYTIDKANLADIEWIASQQSLRYRPEDAIPLAVLREWYDANPSGFHVIRSASGDRIGHIDVLPLKEQTLLNLVEGKIVERDIRGDCLYSVNDRRSIKNLYVESLMITKGHDMSLKCLLRRCRTVADDICLTKKLEIVYALAATPNGEKLLSNLGFAVAKPAHQRRDQHNLYSVSWLALADRVKKILDEGDA